MKRFESVFLSIGALGKALAKRPLFLAGICFTLGVSLCVTLRPQAWVWALGIAAGILLGYRFRKSCRPVFLTALSLCALSAGGLRADMDFPAAYAWLPGQRTEAVLTGRVASSPIENEWGTVLVLDTATIRTGERTVALKGRVRLQVYGDVAGQARYGRQVTADAVVSLPDGARYPGDFDYRMYLLGQGIQYTAGTQAESVRFFGEAAWADPMAWGAFVRNGIEIANKALYPEPARGVMAGILLGGHSGIGDGDYRAFQDTGIAHVLSVSGLHVGYLVAGLIALLRLLRIRNKAQWWCVAGFLAFYCMVVGFVPSVLRASVMALVLLYGRANGHRQDGLSALAAALILVLLINPLDLFSAGFLLSFSATLGIILLYSPLVHVLRKLPKYIRESMAVCLSAQLGMLPIMATVFNSFSMIAVVANLLLIPLFAVLIAAGFAGVLLYAVTAVLAAPFAFVCIKLIDGMLFCVHALSGISFAAIHMVSWPVWLGALWMAGLWLVSRSGGLTPKRRAGAAGALAVIAAAGLVIGWIAPQPLKIVMLDVGQAECIMIRTPDRRAYLVDCGAPAGSDPYKNSEITEYLLKNGINALEGIIVTHGHFDHTAELDVVTQVFSPGWVAFIQGSKESVALHGAKRIELARPGTVIDLGGGTVAETVSVRSGEGNEGSLMFVVKYGEFSMLFTGDAEKAQELGALRRLDRIDVLKVGHHGSDTSTTKELLDTTQPSVALVSVGDNAYGLPDEAPLRRLQARGITVYRTDEDGCIEIVSQKDRFTVEALAQPIQQRGGND